MIFRTAITFLGAALITCCALTAQSLVTWQSSLTFQAAVPIDGLDVGPIVGSPLPDFVVCQTTTSQVLVYSGNGPSVAPTLLLTLAVGASPRRVVARDVDGDGDRDIVTAGSTGITILAFSGLTSVRTDWPLMNPASDRLEVTDIDQDGDPDILRGSVALINNGTSGYAVQTLAVANGAAFDAMPGDVDADGDLDFMRLDNAAGTIDVFLNSGSASYPATPSYSVPAPIGGNLRACVADMNGDSRADVVVVRTSAAIGAFVSMLLDVLNSVPGGFAPAVTSPVCGNYASTAFVSSPIPADLNSDGSIDILLAIHLNTSSISFSAATQLLNNGQGGLLAPNEFHGSWAGQVQNQPRPLVAADLDLDGDIDVAVAAPVFVPDTLFFYSGQVSSQSAPAPASLSIVSGDQQTASLGSTFNQPLVVRALDGTGAPIAGLGLSFGVLAGPASIPTTPLCAVTDASGFATTTVSALTSAVGAVTVAAIAPGLAPVMFQLTVTPPPTITGLLGSGQSAIPGLPFAQQCAAQVIDAFGIPVAGVPVTVSTTGGISVANAPLVTDASGIVLANVLASATSGPATLTLTTQGFAPSSTTFALTVLAAPTVTLISGDNQATDFGEAWPDPLVCEVRDASGQPVANYPIRYVTLPSGGTNQNVVVVPTNTAGRASVTMSTGPTASGAILVAAVFDLIQLPGVVFDLFARKLTLTPPAPTTQVTVFYRHEDGPQPLVLAVDLPLAAPGFVATPYGNVATSILSPSPDLYVFDTFGAFGVQDSGLLANPTFLRTYAIGPGFSGLTVVVQVYGFDAGYFPDLSRAIFVSNAVTVTL